MTKSPAAAIFLHPTASSQSLVNMPLHEKNLRVLSIEEFQTNPGSLKHELEKINPKFFFKKIHTLEEFTEQLKKFHWNIIFSDFKFGSWTALDAINVAKVHSHDTPFVLFSDGVGEEAVADLMKAGIDDIVLKSRPERLLPVTRRILREYESRDKEARAQKAASDAFAAKEQMLAIVSHDIKNPLSAIQLEAQMLLRSANRAGKSLLSEEVKIQGARILKTTDRMKTLISDLLDRNKSHDCLSHLKKNDTYVIRLLQEVLDSLRPLVHEKDLMIKLAVSDHVMIHVDRSKMFQVFSNLLNNAIKFTPQGGTIQIALEENEQEFIFSVDDSGPGLKEQDLQHVFEKYWSSSESNVNGTGLGLFICKTIIEAHGGHIQAENLDLNGARFRFYLPKPSQTQKVVERKGNDLRKSIVIVDDDDDLREVIGWALSKEGFAIHSFSSPSKALEKLSNPHFRPNLIVVDFHMDEMNGGEFVLKKNEIFNVKSCPVVMISASPHEVEELVSHEHYKEVITKPIDLEGLVDNVRKFLQ